MTTKAATEPVVIKRRISWAEFYKLRPDLKPANDDDKKEARKGSGTHQQQTG